MGWCLAVWLGSHLPSPLPDPTQHPLYTADTQAVVCLSSTRAAPERAQVVCPQTHLWERAGWLLLSNPSAASWGCTCVGSQHSRLVRQDDVIPWSPSTSHLGQQSRAAVPGVAEAPHCLCAELHRQLRAPRVSATVLRPGVHPRRSVRSRHLCHCPSPPGLGLRNAPHPCRSVCWPGGQRQWGPAAVPPLPPPCLSTQAFPFHALYGVPSMASTDQAQTSSVPCRLASPVICCLLTVITARRSPVQPLTPCRTQTGETRWKAESREDFLERAAPKEPGRETYAEEKGSREEGVPGLMWGCSAHPSMVLTTTLGKCAF